MPIAIPNDHMIAIAESSLISVFFDIYSMPKAEIMLKTVAPISGLKPRKYPIPIPPNEVCVIPPLMNTIRLVTMYVPIIPHEMLVKVAANTAF